MKSLKVLMLSTAAYAAATQFAFAEPVSFSIFSALYSIGIPGAIANAISLIAIPALAIAGSLTFGRARTPSINPSDAKSVFESSAAQVMEGIGRVRVGGLQAFGASDGSTRVRLVCRLQGPIDAVEEYYIGGREVTVEANGDVSSPPWVRVGGSWCNWQDKIGDGSETAWVALLSLFPSLWTVYHWARGIAQSLTIWYNPGLSEDKYFTLYQGGIPSTEQVIRAAKIYDPRTGLTAWTDNGVLACAHIQRRDPAFTFDMFDWSLIAAEATKADAIVATRTGSEKRARAWGIWGWETTRNDVLKQMFDSVGVEPRVTAEGKIWYQLIDDAHTSEIEFEPLDALEVTLRSGPEAVERPNICRVTYYSPERNYELAEINLDGIGWASVEDEVAVYGPKYFDLELPFCPSASQAQRIARRKFAQARGDTGVIQTDMFGVAAWGLLYAQVTLPDLGDVLDVRIEAPRIDDDQGTVEIPFAVWPELTAWNPATDEAPAPDAIPDFGYDSGLITPNAPTALTEVIYPDASTELRIGFALPAQTYDDVECTYRTYTGGLPNSWLGTNEFPPAPGTLCAYVATNIIGTTVDARVRVFNAEDGSSYSQILNAVVNVNNTACAAPTLVSSVVNEDYSAVFTLTVFELQAAYLFLEKQNGSTWDFVEYHKVRPGQQVPVTIINYNAPESTAQWRISTRTTDGTTSPFLAL